MDVPECLGTVVKLVSSFDDDMTVRSDEEGWNIACLDKARVAMISMTIPASAFGEYVPSGEFGVKCGEIAKLIPKAESLEVSDGWFRLKGRGWTRRTRTIEADPPIRIPDVHPGNGAMLDSDLMLPVITEFDAKSMQAVHIALGDDGLKLSVGDEKESMESEIPADDMVSVTVDGAPVNAAYPLEYWQVFLKALPRGTFVQLEFADDYPLIASFGIGDMTGRWMVAPRIEGD